MYFCNLNADRPGCATGAPTFPPPCARIPAPSAAGSQGAAGLLFTAFVTCFNVGCGAAAVRGRQPALSFKRSAGPVNEVVVGVQQLLQLPQHWQWQVGMARQRARSSLYYAGCRQQLLRRLLQPECTHFMPGCLHLCGYDAGYSFFKLHWWQGLFLRLLSGVCLPLDWSDCRRRVRRCRIPPSVLLTNLSGNS